MYTLHKTALTPRQAMTHDRVPNVNCWATGINVHMLKNQVYIIMSLLEL